MKCFVNKISKLYYNYNKVANNDILKRHFLKMVVKLCNTYWSNTFSISLFTLTNVELIWIFLY